MALELTVFGSTFVLGSYDFFTLMDEKPAAQKGAEVLSFKREAAYQPDAGNDGAFAAAA